MIKFLLGLLKAHFQRHGDKYKGGAWVAIAITVVSAFEGYSSKPYVDGVGRGHPETWCFGETKADGPPPPYSKVFTKEECQSELGRDLPKYDAPLQKCLKPAVYAALPPHRHAALVSLAYNVGDSAVCKSRVVRELNAGNVAAACNDFLAFDRANGRVLKGLANRRRAERVLCLRND